MNSRLVSINYYDRLPGLGAKPILYRAIILKVIVFAVIELYHYNKWKHSSLKNVSYITNSNCKTILAILEYE